jgi:hypothetical protein
LCFFFIGIFKDLDNIYDKLRNLGFDRAQATYIMIDQITLYDSEYTLHKSIKIRQEEQHTSSKVQKFNGQSKGQLLENNRKSDWYC